MRTKSWPPRNGTLSETMPPIEALRAWMLLFVDYIAAKKIIAPAPNTLMGDPKKVFEASCTQVREAIRALMKCVVKSGEIRKDLDHIDLLRALIGGFELNCEALSWLTAVAVWLARNASLGRKGIIGEAVLCG